MSKHLNEDVQYENGTKKIKLDNENDDNEELIEDIEKDEIDEDSSELDKKSALFGIRLRINSNYKRFSGLIKQK